MVSAGDVVLVRALTFRILPGSRDLALTLVDTTQQLGAIADTLQIILQPHAIVGADAPPALAQGDVRFEQVRFAYPDRAAVLDGLNLHIPAGQKVGIVGPSGAGTSTLIALIQRLDDVQSGRVLIDGQDIRSVSQDSLREKIACSRTATRHSCVVAVVCSMVCGSARRWDSSRLRLMRHEDGLAMRSPGTGRACCRCAADRVDARHACP